MSHFCLTQIANSNATELMQWPTETVAYETGIFLKRMDTVESGYRKQVSHSLGTSYKRAAL